MKSKRIFSLLLSLVMIFSMAAASVPAQAAPAPDAVVYMTVSNQGLLASDNDGNAMANREVTVKDIDKDGKLTYDEALAAAHKAYNSENGYAAFTDNGYTGVTKLWGVETYNTMFFSGNEGVSNGVGAHTVAGGDRLVASINKDGIYYADWYTFFDSTEKTVKTNEEFTLTLKGHLGMAYLEEDLADTALSDISIGTWENGKFTEISEKATDAGGKVTLSFDKPGTYYVTASGTVKDEVTVDWSTNETAEKDCPIIAPVCVVTVESYVAAPTSVTISHDAKYLIGDAIVTKKGEKFRLKAYDQAGIETPVTWEKTSASDSTFSIDESTGEVEVTGDIYSSVTYAYFKATSTLDETVSADITIKATGYMLSEYQKNQTVALSPDGQSAKTASLTGGQKDHNIWSYNIPEGVAKLAADPGSGNSIKFNVLRPGTFEVTFKLDINEEYTDTATFTVTGVAVEDADGNNTKTYLGINSNNTNPTKQLTAYVADGKTVASWTSADETVATVDENGLVTAKAVGSTIITAVDSDGTRGGIKVVVESEEIPYFESLEFATTALTSGAWVKDETFAPTTLTYDLPIKTYSAGSLTLQAATLYDTDKYTAFAEYTDVNGEKQRVNVNSGKATTLANQPFDDSVMTITVADKNNADNKTVYIFNVSRPRDTTKAIKSTSGIVLSPTGRALCATAYNGVIEGTMQKADENGEPTSGTGVSAAQYYYRSFVYDNAESFRLSLSSSTTYAHIRYSTDGGEIWNETAQGGGETNAIAVPKSGAAEIIIQIIDDAAYSANVKDGKDGFADTEPTQYKLWIDSITLSAPKMLTAEVTGGDWYPAFSPDMYSYWIAVGNKDDAPVLHYTVSDKSSVKAGTTEQTADEDGKYTLTLGTAQTSIIVTSEDGNFSNTYKFGYKKKSALDVPDKVVDYLCIGSQYTNVSYGINPEATLAGGSKSLGNFGGYITYYYEKPITDNPYNKYGMDFYVIGNSSETNIDSMAELGQVYISEDGNNWYALAGSEHYEDKAVWDYTITYTKGDDGKSYWTDNRANSINYAAKAWPSAGCYYMNDVANKDSYTFTGILFKSRLGSIMGDSSSNANFAASAKFGYADYYASNVSGTALTDVNSYVANPSKANGFDVAWAVDKDGIPVDVSTKEFHYIKVATASNIYAGSFAEKSTEVTYVARTTAQEDKVGVTAAPTGVTISDGADSKTVNFTEGKKVYYVNLDNMKYVSVTVNGTSEDDNIYVNNQRVVSGSAAKGFKVTKENGEKLVRVIVQNGDKEPVIYLLKLTSNASESNELIEGIKIDAGGTVRDAAAINGNDYTASVGHKINSISIIPIADQNVSVTLNGEELADFYDLTYGSNTFEITASDADGNKQTVTLTVTRDNAPVSTGKTITVKFTLYGDEKHENSQIHTYKNDKSRLPVWIAQKSYTVDSGSTVLDIFETALKEAGLTWKNDGGNYIFEIDGLAEFDNGPLSGWLYCLNGTYPGLGAAEQTLKNGDRIIFHYTDDYTQEQDSKEFTSSGSGNKAPNKTEDKSENKTETAQTSETCPFVDAANHWAYEAIKYVYNKSIMQGSAKEIFAPDEGMTRAMLVTVLYRLENPEVKERTHSFSDIADGQWYAQAVCWAAESKVVNGVSETEFAPNDNITREQMATVIYRYAKMKGYDTEKASELAGFEDANEISEYAQDAVKWANAAEIINGVSENRLSPKTTATRAQAAAILMRFCKIYAK